MRLRALTKLCRCSVGTRSWGLNSPVALAVALAISIAVGSPAVAIDSETNRPAVIDGNLRGPTFMA